MIIALVLAAVAVVLVGLVVFVTLVANIAQAWRDLTEKLP